MLRCVSRSPSPPSRPPRPPAQPKSVTRFEATAQLVVVEVTAKDTRGNPIKGLKPGDFTIPEDGKKQDIKVFQYQELEEPVMPEPQLQPRPAVTQAPPAP